MTKCKVPTSSLPRGWSMQIRGEDSGTGVKVIDRVKEPESCSFQLNSATNPLPLFYQHISTDEPPKQNNQLHPNSMAQRTCINMMSSCAWKWTDRQTTNGKRKGRWDLSWPWFFTQGPRSTQPWSIQERDSACSLENGILYLTSWWFNL